MIKDSLYFNYDGINSAKYGLMNVNYSSGLFEEPFLPEQEIYTEQIPGRNDLYYLGNKQLPIQINLMFYLEKGIEDKIAKWLFQEYYKPLIFSNAPNRIYYCMYIGETNLLHTCNKDGLIQLSMRNIDSYARSRFYKTNIYRSVKKLNISNLGDVDIFPDIELKILEDMSTFTIVNESNNTLLKLINLNAGDIISINLSHKIVEAINNNVKIYRYANMVLNNFKLGIGNNRLYINEHGYDWKMRLKYLYKFI